MKKIVPYGNRILVRRRRVGDKLGSGLLIAAEETASRPTDLADVVYLPEQTFVDDMLVANAEAIVKKMADLAVNGEVGAIDALEKMNQFLRIKALKVGMTVFISKYVGTDFHDNENPSETLTLVDSADIVGRVREV